MRTGFRTSDHHRSDPKAKIGCYLPRAAPETPEPRDPDRAWTHPAKLSQDQPQVRLRESPGPLHGVKAALAVGAVSRAWPSHHQRDRTRSVRSGTQTRTRQPEQTTAEPAAGRSQRGTAPTGLKCPRCPAGELRPLGYALRPEDPKAQARPHEPATCTLLAALPLSLVSARPPHGGGVAGTPLISPPTSREVRRRVPVVLS